LKKEIKHDCPTGMIFSNKAGKCVNPELDDNDESLSEFSEDPEARQKIPTKSLRFKHTAGAGVDGVSNESDD